jgi:mono/diheme cytochrome c family protein
MNIGVSGAALLGLALAATFPSRLSAQGARSVWDGVYTQDQTQKGRDLYSQHCAVCHGNDLGGGEEAPALAGADFISNWNGLTAGDLFERMRTTMPQNKPQSLTREVNATILAFILSSNKFPPGQAELSSQTEQLKMIRIEGPKSDQKH